MTTMTAMATMPRSIRPPGHVTIPANEASRFLIASLVSPPEIIVVALCVRSERDLKFCGLCPPQGRQPWKSRAQADSDFKAAVLSSKESMRSPRSMTFAASPKRTVKP